MDWPSGTLYVKASSTVRRDMPVGQVVRSAWVWHDVGIAAALPNVDIATLKLSFQNDL